MMLDSNILIGYLNGDESIRSTLYAWREAGTVLFISHISVIEALSFAASTDEEIVRIEEFLNDFIILPLDMESSRYAAKLRRNYRLSLPDAIIAASALIHNVPLVTRDKHLQNLAGIQTTIV